MSLEVMLDLETLSIRHDAAIVSIGAVKFDPYGNIGQLGDPDNAEYKPFYMTIDMHDSVNVHGFHVDGQTVKWWLSDQVTNEARNALQVDAYPLDVVLSHFWQWFGPESLPTWGNGANFDNAILRTAFEKLGGVCPFKFYHDRCFRTVKALLKDVVYVKPTLAHHALSDAEAQAIHLQKLYNFLNRA
jgi:DNA polymerase III epsilon subunit-like protein